MPEGLVRLHRSGQAHFLTFSCHRRQPLLSQLHMEDAFLHALEEVRVRFAFYVFGYVVMPEHVHLLISEPQGETLPKAMQLLKATVSIASRKQGGRKAGGEPFWQARYFDHNVRNHSGFVTQHEFSRVGDW
jgi:putative transposase